MPTTAEETEKNETSEAKNNDLLLDSLEIKGYRCFEHLTIEKLGRVNLIVGKNNVGKTALLETIEILGSYLPDADQFLSRRNEIQQDPLSNLNKLRKAGFNNLVFQKEGRLKAEDNFFQIGKKNSPILFRPELISHNDEHILQIADDRHPFEPSELDSRILLSISSTNTSDSFLIVESQ